MNARTWPRRLAGTTEKNAFHAVFDSPRCVTSWVNFTPIAVPIPKVTNHTPNPRRYASGKSSATVTTPSRAYRRFATSEAIRNDVAVTAAANSPRAVASSPWPRNAAVIAPENGYCMALRRIANST